MAQLKKKASSGENAINEKVGKKDEGDISKLLSSIGENTESQEPASITPISETTEEVEEKTQTKEEDSMFAKSINDLAEFGQENIETAIECCEIASEVSKSSTDEISEFASKLLSESFSTVNKLMECKSPFDVVSLQSDLCEQGMNATFNQVTKPFEAAERMCELINKRIEKLNT